MTYTNALKNITERALRYYRKSLKVVSKILAETVSELWSERADAIKKLELQTPSDDEPQTALPADQPI